MHQLVHGATRRRMTASRILQLPRFGAETLSMKSMLAWICLTSLTFDVAQAQAQAQALKLPSVDIRVEALLPPPPPPRPPAHAPPPMGKMPNCDDGELEWQKDVDDEGGLDANTKCQLLKIDAPKFSPPEYECERDNSKLVAGEHKCMNISIYYGQNVIPNHGRHRPVWPIYGEYKFCPPQRWIHSLEHGAVVGLYHPCADPVLVQDLRSLLTGCLRRHILTPSRRLTRKYPLALVSWGCYMKMDHIGDEAMVWIKSHALHSPEWAVWMDGEYKKLLQKKAKKVTDQEDSSLCPAKLMH